MSVPFYVSPEQFMRDRSDYARKGIARGRSVVVIDVRRRRAVRRREPLAGAAQGQRDLRPDRVRRRRQVQRVREPAHRRRPARRPARLLLRPPRRHRPRRWPTRTRRPSARSSPTQHKPYEVEICVAEVGDPDAPRPTSSTGSPTTARSSTSTASWRWAARPSRSSPRSMPVTGAPVARAKRCRSRVTRWQRTVEHPAQIAPTSSRSPS